MVYTGPRLKGSNDINAVKNESKVQTLYTVTLYIVCSLAASPFPAFK